MALGDAMMRAGSAEKRHAMDDKTTIQRCMEILEDVPGATLIDRVNRIVDWHQTLSEQYHALSSQEGK